MHIKSGCVCGRHAGVLHARDVQRAALQRAHGRPLGARRLPVPVCVWCAVLCSSSASSSDAGVWTVSECSVLLTLPQVWAEKGKLLLGGCRDRAGAPVGSA